MLALRTALDKVSFGVVLLDNELRAQFINRAFRAMWRLPDAKADSKPAFVALMYHGRDTRAYEVPVTGIDAYIAERVALIKAGDPTPRDLQLANGEMVRLQCAILPGGGRMLSYTYVTDIVRHSDELEVLRAALDKVEEGIILLDPEFNATFMNRAVRRLWHVSDAQAERRPPYTELVGDARQTGTYGVAADKLDAFIEARIALVRAGDPMPRDLRTRRRPARPLALRGASQRRPHPDLFRHHRPGRQCGNAAAAGDHRCPDQPQQPAAFHGIGERRMGPLPALPASAVDADGRYRPLQVDQRQLRPSNRGSGDHRGRAYFPEEASAPRTSSGGSAGKSSASCCRKPTRRRP